MSEYARLVKDREQRAEAGRVARRIVRQRNCLILGGADCVWDDVEAFFTTAGSAWVDTVIAVNDIGAVWPMRLHHWVSLHAEKFPRWQQQRRDQGLSCRGIMLWGMGGPADRPLPRRLAWQGGSSGLTALWVGVAVLKHAKAVLCGIPMTATHHFAESSRNEHIVLGDGRWAHADKHWPAWEKTFRENEELMITSVRSMSGRTRELFGPPSSRWIDVVVDRGEGVVQR